MKKKVLIGIVLLLMVGIVAGCGKTTTVTTTATVTNMATVTQPVTTTTTGTVTTTQTSTATATTNTTTTATVTTTVTATPTAAAPTLSFNAKTYTNTANKFSFKYNELWVDKGSLAGSNAILAWFASAQYSCPGVHVSSYPKATGSTLADVLKSAAYMAAITASTPVIGTTDADKTNVYGTTAMPITWKFNGPDGGTLDARSFGFINGDNWYVMTLYNAPVLGTLSDIYPDEVFSTWQFTK